MKKKKSLWAITYVAFLIAFTIYIALDTFVIEKVYSSAQTRISENLITTDESSENKSENQSSEAPEYTDNNKMIENNQGVESEENTQSEENIEKPQSENTGTNTVKTSTDTNYEDDNIKINLTTQNYNDTVVYIADIQLSSADYLKTALAQNLYGRNVTAKTSDTAEENSAILAINGDYYGAQERGYVIKNGVLYRDTAKENQEDLVIYADGSFEIIREDEITAEELLQKGVVNLLSFGPALVEDGEISVGTQDEVGRAKASNPRTAIAVIDDLHYVFIVADGRTNESRGLSLYELAQFAQSLGAKTVYNLDGGGSSTMYFNGNIINNPTTNGNTIRERSVSDIVYIGY